MPIRSYSALAVLCSVCFSAPALAVYKCTQQGQVHYSDLPCVGSTLELQGAGQHSPNRTDAELTREKAELSKLQNNREQRERQDEQFRNMSLRGEAARQKKCRALDLQRKWKEEDLKEALPAAQSRARRHARRATEKYQSECS